MQATFPRWKANEILKTAAIRKAALASRLFREHLLYRGLDSLDVLGLPALGAFDNVELHLLPFL